MTKDKSRIQSCIDHINTAVDVDPWAKELVAEMGKEILKQLTNSKDQLNNSNDAISRQAAIDHFKSITVATSIGNKYNEGFVDGLNFAVGHLKTMPSIQPDVLDTNVGDLISRQGAIDALEKIPVREFKKTDGLLDALISIGQVYRALKQLPSVQPTHTNNSNTLKSLDCVDRQEAIDAAKHAWAKGLEPSQYIEDLPSVQPEVLACGSGELNVPSELHWIPVTERMPEPRTDVWVNSDIGQIQGYYEENAETWYASFGQGRDYLELIVNAWMPLPEPYQEGE